MQIKYEDYNLSSSTYVNHITEFGATWGRGLTEFYVNRIDNLVLRCMGAARVLRKPIADLVLCCMGLPEYYVNHIANLVSCTMPGCPSTA